MNRVVHFEIHADDCERAMQFYTEVFGWQFQKWEGSPTEYHMLITGDKDQPGINGGLLKRMGPSPLEGQAVNSFVCTIDVANIDESMQKIEKAGGKLAAPKVAIPNMAWLAYYKDTEGNIFGLFQEDKNAK